MAQSSRSLLPAAALLALGIGPPAAVLASGLASWAWLAAGAASWAAAVAAKAVLGAWLWPALGRIARGRFVAGFWGTWSASCELGATALVLACAGGPATLGGGVALGVGAGAAESLLVLGLAAVRAEVPVPWSAVRERLLASVGHLSSRALVWAAFASWASAPGLAAACAAVAFAAFAAVDGYATHGVEAGWDWADPLVSSRFYRVVAALTALEAAAFATSLLAIGGASGTRP